MARRAEEHLAELREALRAEPGANRLVPLVASGEAGRHVLARLGAEQHRIIAADWRAFLTLAAASTGDARVFFTSVAQGEQLASALLLDYTAACGLSAEDLAEYRPLPGCQSYPAFIAWLALNADPRDALMAIIANFAEWGGYCAKIAASLREHYDFTSDGVGFFEFFAAPNADLDNLGVRAVQEALDSGWVPRRATEHALLLHSYELGFWNTLADQES